MSKGALDAFSPLTLQLAVSVTFLWIAVGVTGQRIGRDGEAHLAAPSGLLEPGLVYALGTFGRMLTTAAVFPALYDVVSSRFVTGIAPVFLAALQQSVGLAFALALVLGWSSFATLQDELARADRKAIAVALGSGVVQSALAFWFYWIGLRSMAASTAALLLTLTPVFGLGGAVAFRNQTVGWLRAIGAVTIIVAVASARRALSA